MDSMRAIAKFFSITIDELLSPDELLTIPNESKKKKTRRFRDLVFGLCDLSVVMLLFLPLFAERSDGVINGVSLISMTVVQPYLKPLYFVIVISTIVSGVLMFVLQNAEIELWDKNKNEISLVLSAISLLLFILSLHPYAAAFSLLLLVIKVLLFIKR